jgi:flagellar export protein FliJ
VLIPLGRRREALVAADREVRTLEKLRESQHERFRREEETRETKRLDEVAGRRAAGEDER